MKRHIKNFCFISSILVILTVFSLYTFGMQGKNPGMNNGNRPVESSLPTSGDNTQGTVHMLSNTTSGSTENSTDTSDAPTQSIGSNDKSNIMKPEKFIVNCSLYNTLLLDDTGDLQVFGMNNADGSGTSNNAELNNKVVFKGLKNIKCITSGIGFVAVLREDGTVWIYGDYNNNNRISGQPSQLTTAFRQLEGLTEVVQIASGPNHLLALKSNGTVWSWGDNTSGQLGDESLENRESPVKVSSLADIVNISAGLDFSAAVKKDGSVWTWGGNCYNQLGDGNPGGTAFIFDEGFDRNIPYSVKGLNDITGISCGWQHILALNKNGYVYAWGNDMSGQLGDGSAVVWRNPSKIEALDEVFSISAGLGHSLALRNDGTVWEWGDEFADVDNVVSLDKSKPYLVDNLKNIKSVSAGYLHSVAIGQDGSFWSWGNNDYGQLCDDTKKAKRKPEQFKIPDTLSESNSGRK